MNRDLSKIEYSQKALPTVCVKKRSKEIRFCTDFSTGLNAALKDYHYPLLSPEEIFAKLNVGKKTFQKSTSVMYIFKYRYRKKLLYINAHRGLYKFERLPLGV